MLDGMQMLNKICLVQIQVISYKIIHTSKHNEIFHKYYLEIFVLTVNDCK